MAIIKAETFQGFSHLPALRQLGLMIALAASVAIGVAVVLWSQTPDYSLLYGKLSNKSASQILESLQKINVKYKLDPTSGAILVPAADVHRARIHLAKEGLPRDTGSGLEFLSKEESFKTSKFTQYRRYIHAQEIELARSISNMRNVESARVHLAITERSAFIGREQGKAKATVMVKLYGGRSLKYGQVKAIVHMVSSAIPRLDAKAVAVIDQHGQLLTRSTGNDNGMTDHQFDYKNRIEHKYTKKIVDLITPIVGDGRVRAKVEVELDFTRTEQTRESYNPDYPAVSSESITERKNKGSTGPSGTPGALTNQPAKTGTTNTANKSTTRTTNSSNSTSKSVTRNYRNDKTISYIKSPAGKIKRISIAVLLDDKRSVDEEGTETKTPLTKKELGQLTALIKEATGFTVKRGDTIKVTNTSFYTPPPPKPLPPVPFLEQPWVWTVAKQAVGIIVVLVLFFAVLKPVMRSLAEKGVEVAKLPATQQVIDSHAQASAEGAEQAPLALPDHGSDKYDEKLTIAKNMVGQDPGRVAQVVKNWVSHDG